MTVYTQKEYCEKYGMHINTLRNRKEKGTLPSYHVIKEIEGRGFVIVVDHCELCNLFEKACREYNQKCIGRGHNPELAAELSIKYKINTARLFRTLGL